MDYYKVLDLEKDASNDQIKKAYRKKAMKLHPDRNPDNKNAECEFKELVSAYRVLSDTKLKKQYDLGIFSETDEFNEVYSNMFNAMGNMENIYGMFNEMMNDYSFNVNTKYGVNFKMYKDNESENKEFQKGDDIKYNINVNLEDIYNCVTKPLKIGRMKNLNNIYQKDFKEFNLNLHKREICFYKEGNEIKNVKCIPGDIIIKLFDKQDPNFKRININDLIYTKTISPIDIYQDKEYEIEMLDGTILTINIKRDTLLESRLIEIEDKGLPNVDFINPESDLEIKIPRGKLYIYFNIVFRTLDHKQLQRLEKVYNEKIDKVKSIKHNSDFNIVNLNDIIS